MNALFRKSLQHLKQQLPRKMNPFQHIHQTYLKVLADLLHHLQLSFISWRLKDRSIINQTCSWYSFGSHCPLHVLSRASQILSVLPSASSLMKRYIKNFLSLTHTDTLTHQLLQTLVPLTGLRLIALITLPSLNTVNLFKQAFDKYECNKNVTKWIKYYEF